MTRPVDWYPLAVLDPVAGEPGRVRAAGQEYARVARQIARSAEDLRAIATEVGGGSQAVEEVAAKAARLADTIERAHGRYAAAGEALQTYADELADAQEIADSAHAAAVRALQAQDEAFAAIRRWTRFAEGASTPIARDRYLALVDDARADLYAADSRLDQARTDLRVAVARRDGAVSAACATIRGAMARDDLHDTIWQDVGGGAQEVGLALWNGVDEVAAWTGTAAVVLCWVPGVNGVFAAAATVAGVAALARDSVNLATGNGSVDDVRGSALGVATFGVGRFAQQAIRLSVASARGGRALRHSGLVDDAVGAAGTAPSRAAAAGVGRGRLYGGASVRSGSTGVLRSPELWNHMRPGVIARDTWKDLRGGVDLVRAPGLYRPSARGHVQRPVDAVANPLEELRVEVSSNWDQSRRAGVLTAVGNEAAARALTAVPERTARGWVALSGGVQVVESGCGLSPVLPSERLRDSCALRLTERKP